MVERSVAVGMLETCMPAEEAWQTIRSTNLDCHPIEYGMASVDRYVLCIRGNNRSHIILFNF